MAYEKYMTLVWFPWLLISCVPWLLMPSVFTIVSNHPLEIFLCEGGTNGPLINFMSWMVKSYGRTVSWGVSSLQLWLTLCLTSLISIPWSGLGLAITNLCHDKKIDGVAKLITKTDISGLKNNKTRILLQECELFLTRAWKECESSSKQVTLKWKIFGQAMIRSILMLVKKEKLGKEGKEYKLTEIEALFAKGMTGEDTPHVHEAFLLQRIRSICS